jgi:predicted Zn-dependent peptidase
MNHLILPNITKLSTGLTILTYKMPDIKTVAINLIVTVGSRLETEKENGISHFLEHMAFKGTKTRTARAIAEEFDAMVGS